jgi:phospholipase C
MTGVEHVVVLALENRSFDHLLGYLDHPNANFDGLGDAEHSNPGWNGGPPVSTSPTAKTVLPVGPDHSHDSVMEQLGLAGRPLGSTPTNDGFVINYERAGRGLGGGRDEGVIGTLLTWLRRNKTPAPPVEGRGPLAMRCQPPAQVPVLSRLAVEFALCQRWFCSVPGETWPNRNFMHAATSDGETDIDPRFYTNPTIFEQLEENDKTWHIYHDDTPQVWAFERLWDSDKRRANWFEFPAFLDHVAAGTLPHYSFIEPNHRPAEHDATHAPVIGSPDISNSQHPGNSLVADADYDAYPAGESNDFTRAETLIASIYEALRANPELFASTVLVITYDEHGGLYDHVPPPTDAKDPGFTSTLGRRVLHALYRQKAAAFDFHTLGPRVPTLVISPLVERETLSNSVFDHSSIPATVRKIFMPTAAELTARDGNAHTFEDLLTRTAPRVGAELPDLSSFLTTSVPATGAAVTTLPGPTPTPTAVAALVPPRLHPGGHVPRHYDPFVDLAQDVGKRLRKLGVDAPKAARNESGLRKATQTSQAFVAAAERSRNPA